MSSPTLCPSPAALERWLVGRIDGPQADEIERHLDTCDRCAGTLSTLRAEDDLSAALRPPLGPEEVPFRDQAEALIPALKLFRPKELTASWDNEPISDATQASGSTTSGPPLRGVGEQVGPYMLLAQIGAGGMGVVFRAEDLVLRRHVALKLIQPSLVKSPAARERFLREAQAMAALEHDHIVAVFQAGEDDGILYLAMPLLRGRTLQERLDEPAPVPVVEILRIGRETAAGLAAAHARGIVHRDIKPGNIWLEDGTTPPRVKILDFGLAQALRDEPGADDTPGILGTPAYMAPEQTAGKLVDGRADLFSLGCVLYRMATGQQPFAGPNLAAVMRSVTLDEPPPAQGLNPALPAPLARLITRLLRKAPTDRPASADEVVAELTAIEGARARRISRRKWLAWGTGTALAAAAGGVFVAREWFRTPPPAPGEVTFEFDELDARVALQRGDEPERVVDLRAEPVLVLPPGDYAVRALAATDTRRLLTDRVVVPAGEKLAVVLQLVGLVAEHKQHSPFAVGGVVCREKKDQLTVISVGHDRTLVAWNPAAKDRPLQVLDPAGPLRCVALRPDEKSLAVGLGDVGPKAVQAARFRDPDTLQPAKGEYPAKDRGIITALAYSPDGRLLFTAQSDGNLTQWEVRHAISEVDQTHCDAGIHAIALTRDGKHVFSAGGDGTVAEWTAADLKLVRRYRGAVGAVRVVAVLRGDTQFVSAGDDRTIRVWDRKSGAVAASWDAPQPVFTLAVSPDGTRLATGDAAGGLRIWDIAARQEIVHFQAHTKVVTSVAYTRDGRRVVSGGADGAVRLWSVPK